MSNRILTATLTSLMYLTACGVSDPPKDYGDTSGIPELTQPLNPAANAPAFVALTGFLTITFDAAGGETLIVSAHPVTGAILVNDVAIAGATTKTIKKVIINGGVKDDTLILDFANGFFSPGITGSAGWVIDMGTATNGGTDLVKLRGTSLADTVTLGGSALNAKIAFNVDALVDITVVGTTAVGYTFSLGAGNDIFNALAGTYGTVAKFTGPTIVYGGINDDQLTGGDGNDTFFGDLGNDTMNGGTLISDSDVYWGGGGADVVTYAGRAGDVNVTIAPNVTIAVTASADDGDIVGAEGDDIRNDVETVIGGNGNDTFLGEAGNQTFYGGPGNDLFLMGVPASTGAGADTVWGEAGTDTVDYSARLTAITVTMDLGKADDGAALELDNIEADVENLICPLVNQICTVTGNALDNVITGGTGADVLTGGSGDDTFVIPATASGAGTYTGGAGVDLIDFSTYAAVINVKMDGTVSVTGGKKIDVENLICDATNACTVTGNISNNRIWGSSAGDTINSGGGDDFIESNGGADTIDCGDGSDILIDSGGAATATACEL